MTPALGLDAAAIATRWRDRARALRAGGAVTAPPGTPPTELARTPAAARIGVLAADAGLFSFHFEHRLHLPLPAAWLPDGADDLAEPPTWDRGVLAEQKYQSYRHDLPVASFHPHHRAKWSAHELCHGLVGFGWRPDATPLFHATAGRLAELLPVALWYFFDEALLRRCPAHAGDGDLFRTSCDACERLAAPWPEDPDAEARIAEGLRYVERELDAIARTRRSGTVLPHRHATLDLASDGVAYAIAHGRRLDSPAFATFAERFLVAGGGWSPTLEALEDRVLDLLHALLDDRRTPAPLAPSPEHGRWRWVLQDVGWRLHHLAADAAPAVARRLDELSRRLAEAVPATTRADADPAAAATAALAELADALQPRPRAALPTPQEVLGVGYPLPGVPPVVGALVEGLRSALPRVEELLEEGFDALVARFAAADGWRRAPLPVRFADWLAEVHPGPIADLARWEAVVAGVPAAPPPTLGGPAADDRRRLAPGVALVRLDHDPVALATRVEQGELAARLDGDTLDLVVVEGEPIGSEPTALLVAREADGELLVLDLDPDTGAALAALGDDGGTPDVPADDLEALESFGVLLPVALAELRS